MVRQTRIYLAGAVSGTALIVMAIAAFVAVVSLQALRDWPLAGLGDNGDPGSVSVSPARPAGGEAAPVGQRLGTASGARATHAGGRNAPHGATAATEDSGALTGTPAGVRGRNGSDSTQTAAGSQPSGPAGVSPSGGGAAASGAGGGGGGSAPDGESGSPPKLSETVTGTVDETVSGVDEATGGALGETGLPKLTEEVEGVAGPESTVGGTLDHTVEAVGGLLDGGR